MLSRFLPGIIFMHTVYFGCYGVEPSLYTQSWQDVSVTEKTVLQLHCQGSRVQIGTHILSEVPVVVSILQQI